MKKTIRTIFTVLLLLINTAPVLAEGGIDKSADGASYTIEPEKSTLQINEKASYFHLYVKEDTKETLVIKVHNNSDEESTFMIRDDIAKTNENGLIVYDALSAYGPNASLTHNIEDYLSIKQDTITVPAHSSGRFVIELSMNQSKFKGILLGAFTVEEVLEDKQQAGMDQVYLYELGIVLSQTDDLILPNSKTLELGDVAMKIAEGRKVLSYQILNLEAQIARDLLIESRLTKTDDNTIIFDEKVENYSIAPNGILPLNLDWGKKEVKAGNYRLEIKATDGDEKWSWEYEFTIEAEEADSLNDESTYKVSYPKWTFIIFLILGLLTIMNTIYLVRREIKYLKE